MASNSLQLSGWDISNILSVQPMTAPVGGIMYYQSRYDTSKSIQLSLFDDEPYCVKEEFKFKCDKRPIVPVFGKWGDTPTGSWTFATSAT